MRLWLVIAVALGELEGLFLGCMVGCVVEFFCLFSSLFATSCVFIFVLLPRLALDLFRYGFAGHSRGTLPLCLSWA